MCLNCFVMSKATSTVLVLVTHSNFKGLNASEDAKLAEFYKFYILLRLNHMVFRTFQRMANCVELPLDEPILACYWRLNASYALTISVCLSFKIKFL